MATSSIVLQPASDHACLFPDITRPRRRAASTNLTQTIKESRTAAGSWEVVDVTLDGVGMVSAYRQKWRPSVVPTHLLFASPSCVQRSEHGSATADDFLWWAQWGCCPRRGLLPLNCINLRKGKVSKRFMLETKGNLKTIPPRKRQEESRRFTSKRWTEDGKGCRGQQWPRSCRCHAPWASVAFSPYLSPRHISLIQRKDQALPKLSMVWTAENRVLDGSNDGSKDQTLLERSMDRTTKNGVLKDQTMETILTTWTC
jgi:hypothetical protein